MGKESLVEATMRALSGELQLEAKTLTWNEIMDNAEGTTFGQKALKVKDTARDNVEQLMQKDGVNIEELESVEDAIEEYTNKNNIKFDESGNILNESKLVERKQSVTEYIISFMDGELYDEYDGEFITEDKAEADALFDELKAQHKLNQVDQYIAKTWVWNMSDYDEDTVEVYFNNGDERYMYEESKDEDTRFQANMTLHNVYDVDSGGKLISELDVALEQNNRRKIKRIVDKLKKDLSLNDYNSFIKTYYPEYKDLLDSIDNPSKKLERFEEDVDLPEEFYEKICRAYIDTMNLEWVAEDKMNGTVVHGYFEDDDYANKFKNKVNNDNFRDIYYGQYTDDYIEAEEPEYESYQGWENFYYDFVEDNIKYDLYDLGLDDFYISKEDLNKLGIDYSDLDEDYEELDETKPLTETVDTNEDVIIKTMQDKKFLKILDVSPLEIIDQVKLSKAQFDELDKMIKTSGKSFDELYDELGGWNLDNPDKYYDVDNYFDCYYKSLLVTVKVKDGNLMLSPKDVYVYPSDISGEPVDELFHLDFDEPIDYTKIENQYNKSKQTESKSLNNEDVKNLLDNGNVVTVGGKQNYTPTDFYVDTNKIVWYKNGEISFGWEKHPSMNYADLLNHLAKMQKDGFTVEVSSVKPPKVEENKLIKTESNPHRRAVSIKWDVDYDADGKMLPTEVDIPDYIDDEDIPDYLSDKYEFNHDGYVLEIVDESKIIKTEDVERDNDNFIYVDQKEELSDGRYHMRLVCDGYKMWINVGQYKGNGAVQWDYDFDSPEYDVDAEDYINSSVDVNDIEEAILKAILTKKTEGDNPDVEKHVMEYLESNQLYPSDVFTAADRVMVDISWGDWKHDHIRCDKLMENLGYTLVEEEVTEEDGSDCYSAIRHYIPKGSISNLDESVDTKIAQDRKSFIDKWKDHKDFKCSWCGTKFIGNIDDEGRMPNCPHCMEDRYADDENKAEDGHANKDVHFCDSTGEEIYTDFDGTVIKENKAIKLEKMKVDRPEFNSEYDKIKQELEDKLLNGATNDDIIEFYKEISDKVTGNEFSALVTFAGEVGLWVVKEFDTVDEMNKYLRDNHIKVMERQSKDGKIVIRYPKISGLQEDRHTVKNGPVTYTGFDDLNNGKVIIRDEGTYTYVIYQEDSFTQVIYHIKKIDDNKYAYGSFDYDGYTTSKESAIEEIINSIMKEYNLNNKPEIVTENKSMKTEAPEKDGETYNKLCKEIQFQADENNIDITDEQVKKVADKICYEDKYFFNNSLPENDADWSDMNTYILQSIKTILGLQEDYKSLDNQLDKLIAKDATDKEFNDFLEKASNDDTITNSEYTELVKKAQDTRRINEGKSIKVESKLSDEIQNDPEYREYVVSLLKDGAIDDPEYVNGLSAEEFDDLVTNTWMKDVDVINSYIDAKNLNEGKSIKVESADNTDDTNIENIKDILVKSGISNERTLDLMSKDVLRTLKSNYADDCSTDGIYYGVAITDAVQKVVERITGTKPKMKFGEGKSIKTESFKQLKDLTNIDEIYLEIAEGNSVVDVINKLRNNGLSSMTYDIEARGDKNVKVIRTWFKEVEDTLGDITTGKLSREEYSDKYNDIYASQDTNKVIGWNYLDKLGKRYDGKYYEIVEDTYEYPNGLLLIVYDYDTNGEDVPENLDNVPEIEHICINLDDIEGSISDKDLDELKTVLNEGKSLKESTEHFKSLDRLEIQNTLNELLKQRGINTDNICFLVHKDNSDYEEYGGPEYEIALWEKDKELGYGYTQIEEFIQLTIRDDKDVDWVYNRLEELYKQIQNGDFDKYKAKSLKENATDDRFNSTLESWERLGYKLYKQESTITVLINDSKDMPIAIAFNGKASKPIWHYKFSNMDDLDSYVNKSIENAKAREQSKADRKAQRKLTSEHDIKVGDIFYTSWGYDQTNTEFYEVVNVRGSRIDLKEIGYTVDYEKASYGREDITPAPHKFVDDKVYTVSARADGTVTNLEGRDFLNLYKYVGGSHEVTATGWGH